MGNDTPAGNSLLGALSYFGLDGIGASEKEDMRALILRGGPWTEDQRTAILDYCETDIDALERLLPAMLLKIDLPRALLRGRYMAAAAAMEYAGTPIDADVLKLFRHHWTSIQDRLIADIDATYGVFEGRTFKAERFAGWLAANSIPWPLLESGHLDLSDGTFRQQARAHPAVSPLLGYPFLPLPPIGVLFAVGTVLTGIASGTHPGVIAAELFGSFKKPRATASILTFFERSSGCESKTRRSARSSGTRSHERERAQLA